MISSALPPLSTSRAFVVTNGCALVAYFPSESDRENKDIYPPVGGNGQNDLCYMFYQSTRRLARQPVAKREHAVIEDAWRVIFAMLAERKESWLVAASHH